MSVKSEKNMCNGLVDEENLSDRLYSEFFRNLINYFKNMWNRKRNFVSAKGMNDNLKVVIEPR